MYIIQLSVSTAKLIHLIHVIDTISHFAQLTDMLKKLTRKQWYEPLLNSRAFVKQLGGSIWSTNVKLHMRTKSDLKKNFLIMNLDNINSTIITESVKSKLRHTNRTNLIAKNHNQITTTTRTDQ